MQSFWPYGMTGPIKVVGSGRDLYTGPDVSNPFPWGEDRIEITLTPQKRIERIRSDKYQDKFSGFAGMGTGSELRKAMTNEIPEEVAQSTILHRLLDDLGGAAFMASGAWPAWLPGGIKEYDAMQGKASPLARNVEGLCISYQHGSPSMTKDGRTNEAIINQPQGPLPFRHDDPFAWHSFATLDGPNQWRIRQMDLWNEHGYLNASVGFQDSAALPSRTDKRLIFHEYRLAALIDPDSLVLLDIQVTAGVLPFKTCLAAPNTALKLIGQPITDFRRIVPATLPGTAGCTHLNEVLRGLQDIESMAVSLKALAGSST